MGLHFLSRGQSLAANASGSDNIRVYDYLDGRKGRGIEAVRNDKARDEPESPPHMTPQPNPRVVRVRGGHSGPPVPVIAKSSLVKSGASSRRKRGSRQMPQTEVCATSDRT